MSSNITSPSAKKSGGGDGASVKPPSSKGKAKASASTADDAEDNEDGEDEEEEDHGSDAEDDDEEEDPYEEIDPTAIVGRRTRGVRVDYTSKEALEKAGLTGKEKDDDEEELDPDVQMKD